MTTNETCKYWQDYTERVWACISEVRTARCDNQVELRLCKFNPPPTVDSAGRVYTDKDYYCSAFIKDEQK